MSSRVLGSAGVDRFDERLRGGNIDWLRFDRLNGRFGGLRSHGVGRIWLRRLVDGVVSGVDLLGHLPRRETTRETKDSDRNAQDKNSNARLQPRGKCGGHATKPQRGRRSCYSLDTHDDEMSRVSGQPRETQGWTKKSIVIQRGPPVTCMTQSGMVGRSGCYR